MNLLLVRYRCPLCDEPVTLHRMRSIAKHAGPGGDPCLGGGKDKDTAIVVELDPIPLDGFAINIVVADRNWRLGRKLRREEKVEVIRRLRATGTEWAVIGELIGWTSEHAVKAFARATQAAA